MVAFLLAVAVVRLIHIALLPSLVIGMNPKMSCEAKSLVMFGLGGAYIDVPAGPIILLASIQRSLPLSPQTTLLVVVLLAHLALGHAFWRWLDVISPPRGVRRTALVLFLFLPIFNSYEGMDNYPVVLAAALFFAWAAEFHATPIILLGQGARSRARLGAMVLLAGALPLFRAEYCVLLPLYLVLIRCWKRASPSRAVRLWITLLALAIGAGVGGMIRFFDSGDFSLAPSNYACWTFLDGMPPAWLSDHDHTEDDRRRQGIKRFGRPADHDYSLVRMIAKNPIDSAAKFVLNLPGWAYHLGRRHVVSPLPVTALMMIGLFVLWRRKNPTYKRAASILLSTFIMSLPLALIIVNAEYLMTAFPAVCVLAAYGWRGIWIRLRLCADRLPPLRLINRRPRWSHSVALALFCVLMELLLIRGGGLLTDDDVVESVAPLIDEQAESFDGKPLIIDPYYYRIDACCRADVRNRVIVHQHLASESLSPFAIDELKRRDPLIAAKVIAGRGVPFAVLWTREDKSQELFEERLKAWRRGGFVVVNRVEQPDRLGRLCTLVVLARDWAPLLLHR